MSMVTTGHILRRRFQPSIACPAAPAKPYNFIQFIPPAAADARSGTEAGVGKVVALTLLDASERPILGRLVRHLATREDQQSLCSPPRGFVCDFPVSWSMLNIFDRSHTALAKKKRSTA